MAPWPASTSRKPSSSRRSARYRDVTAPAKPPVRRPAGWTCHARTQTAPNPDRALRDARDRTRDEADGEGRGGITAVATGARHGVTPATSSAPSSTRYRRATASARRLPPPSPGRAPAIDPLPWPGPIHRPPESRRPRPRLRSGEPIPRSSPAAGSTQASVGDPAGSTVASPARTCSRRRPTCDVTSEHRADSGDEAPGRSGSSDIPALGGHGRWVEMDAVMAPDLAYTCAASLKPVSRTGVGNGGPIAGFETAWQACTCAGRCAGPVR